MESKVNYTLVGLFVLLLTAGAVAAVAWLTAATDRKRYDTYRVYVTESVTGLNLNAAVRYKGVTIGKVTYIDLDPDNPERVELRLQIEETAPIRAGTVAKLISQGITGLVNIELSGGNNTPPLKPTSDDPLPIITSGPSLVTQLEDTFKDLSQTLKILLSAENVMAFSQTLSNIEKITSALTGRSDALERNLANLETFTSTLATNAPLLETALKNAATTLETSAALSGQITPLVGQVGGSIEAVTAMARTITQTTLELNRSIASTREALLKEIRLVNNNTGPELNNLLIQLNRLATQMQILTQEVNRDPRGFLFGGAAEQRGPGE